MARDSKYIVELLLETGMLSPEQLEEAQREIELNPDTGDIVDIIIKKGFVSQDDLTIMLAQQYGMEMIDLSRYELPEEVISLLDRATVKKYGVIPLGLHDDILTIAMSDPTDVTTLDALRYMLGRDVDAVIAPKAQIEKIINEHPYVEACTVVGVPHPYKKEVVKAYIVLKRLQT